LREDLDKIEEIIEDYIMIAWIWEYAWVE